MLRKQREVKALEAISDAFARALSLLFPQLAFQEEQELSVLFPPLAGLKSHTASAC